MEVSNITCPKCHEQIPLNAAIEGPIAERLQARFDAEAKKREAAFKARESQLAQQEQAIKAAQENMQQQVEQKLDAERKKIVTEQERRAKEAVGIQLRDLQNQLDEKAKKLTEAEQTQLQLLKDKRELDEQKKAFELEKAKQIEAERKKIVEEHDQKVKEEVGVQLRDLQNQLAEKSKKLTEGQQTQLQLLKEKRAFEDQKQAFEVEKAKQIEAERQQIREEAKKSALELSNKAMLELTEKLAAKDKKLAETEQAELKLRHEKADFEEKKRAFDLELARQAEVVKDAVRKEKDEEFRMKEAEATKKLEDMKRQIDELRRKAEQGSQQTQGEVLELDLESALKRCFDGDGIAGVAKGTHGGDILQQVRSELGQDCGTIIWESKRTKAWSEGWLQKLKDDKLAAKAQLAVIVTAVKPKDVATFECRQGIWVTPPALAVPLAAALRLSLIETAAARRAIEGRHDKMEVVYAYLSGPEFKGRVNAIVDSFKDMRDDLEAEERSMQKIWAKREKQIERVLINTAGMHGDLAGIIGKSLPSIELLEMAALVHEADESPKN